MVKIQVFKNIQPTKDVQPLKNVQATKSIQHKPPTYQKTFSLKEICNP